MAEEKTLSAEEIKKKQMEALMPIINMGEGILAKPGAGRLDGKVAVVTGAASGMGRASLIRFLKEGAKVCGGDVNTTRIAEVEEEVKAMGLSDNLKMIVCDITKNEDCDNLVKTCVDTFGTCNVLAHNAGIMGPWDLLDELSDENWNRQININLTGAMKILRASVKYFYENKVRANIVMVTSNSTLEACTGDIAYTAAKCGADGLMKAVAYQYGRYGIRINSVQPGPIMTNISENVQRNPRGVAIHHQQGYNAHSREWTVQPVAHAAQVAELEVFLASDESSFIHSRGICIDGGVCLG